MLCIAAEIEEFATRKQIEASAKGYHFDADNFKKRVEHTRLTTHMDLEQAFEYERGLVLKQEAERTVLYE